MVAGGSEPAVFFLDFLPMAWSELEMSEGVELGDTAVGRWDLSTGNTCIYYVINTCIYYVINTCIYYAMNMCILCNKYIYIYHAINMYILCNKYIYIYISCNKYVYIM